MHNNDPKHVAKAVKIWLYHIPKILINWNGQRKVVYIIPKVCYFCVLPKSVNFIIKKKCQMIIS